MQTRFWGKVVLPTLIFCVVWYVFIPICFKKCICRWFFEVQAPILSTVNQLNHVHDYLALQAHSKDVLLTYCKELSRENAYLKMRLNEVNDKIRHCDNILELNKLRTSEKFNYVLAYVYRRQMESWGQYLILNRGKKDGINTGYGVICSKGIVGRTIEVFNNTCIVELISNAGFKMLVRLEGCTQPMLLKSLQSKPFADKKAELLNIGYEKITCPAKILTTMFCQQFPENLFVGMLTKIKNNHDPVGKVKLGKYLNWLEEVVILVPATNNINE